MKVRHSLWNQTIIDLISITWLYSIQTIAVITALIVATSAYSIPAPAQKVADPAPAYPAPSELYTAPAKSADVYAAPAYPAPAYEAPVVVAPVKAVCIFLS
jgi:hypothetical protein